MLMSYFVRRRVSYSTFIFCGGAGAFSFAMFFLFVFFVVVGVRLASISREGRSLFGKYCNTEAFLCRC